MDEFALAPPPPLLHALKKKRSRTYEPQYRVWQEVENIADLLSGGDRKVTTIKEMANRAVLTNQ